MSLGFLDIHNIKDSRRLGTNFLALYNLQKLQESNCITQNLTLFSYDWYKVLSMKIKIKSSEKRQEGYDGCKTLRQYADFLPFCFACDDTQHGLVLYQCTWRRLTTKETKRKRKRGTRGMRGREGREEERDERKRGTRGREG
jgi:hypothetical protein